MGRNKLCADLCLERVRRQAQTAMYSGNMLVKDLLDCSSRGLGPVRRSLVLELRASR